LFFHYLILNIIFNYGKLAVIYLYIRKNNFQNGHIDNFTIGVEKLSFFLNHFIFILIVVDIVIIDIMLLITSLSLVAVAMVLIFKDYIANFLSGLNLMFSENYRIKDVVKVGDIKGKIANITFQNIQLKTEDGNIVYIPNSIFLTKEIINYSKSSLKNISIDIILYRKELADFEKQKNDLIQKIFNNFSDNLQSLDNIKIFVDKLEKDAITILFELYLQKHSVNAEKSIKAFIRKETGLMFPYN
jgi:small-conductance mechanosensitive channel